MYPFISLSFVYIPVYPIFVSLSFSIGIFWLFQRAPQRNLSQRTVLDMSWGLMLGSLLGARALHVFYESFSFYLNNPLQVLMIWKGGFVFYGGAFGGFLGAFIVLKIKGENWAQWADFLAPVGAFCYGLGRVGCFLAGCCYGQLSSLPWAVSFASFSHKGLLESHILESRHPTQLYAAFIEWGICGLLVFLARKKSFMETSGKLFFTWMALHSMARLLMEFLRDDFRGERLWGWTLSQVLSMFLLFVSLWALTSYRRVLLKRS